MNQLVVEVGEQFPPTSRTVYLKCDKPCELNWLTQDMKSKSFRLKTAVLHGTSTPCRYCREPVDPQARICKHCGTDLTWRRHLAFSNTTLALMTAFLAVVGTVGPIVKDLLKPSAARISADLVGSSGGVVVLLLQNTGGTPAGISRAKIVFGSLDGRTITADLNSMQGAVIVEPGKLIKAEFAYQFGYLSPTKYQNSVPDRALECDLTIDGMSAGEAITWNAKNLACLVPLLDFHLFMKELIKQDKVKLP